MQKFKILEEWLEVDEKTGQYIRYARIKPMSDGGDEKVIRLGFDKSKPFNQLLSDNGYFEVKDSK